MAINVSDAQMYLAGMKRLEVAKKQPGKFLRDLTEDDWLFVGDYKQGTLTDTGEAGTTTPRLDEGGVAYRQTTSQGTYGFEGDLWNFAPEVMQFLCGSVTLDLSQAPANSSLAGQRIESIGKNSTTVSNLYGRFPVIDGSGVVKYVYFYNLSLTSKPTIVGNLEEDWSIHTVGAPIPSNDADDTNGQVMGFGYLTDGSGTTPPVATPSSIVIPQGGTTTAITVTFSKPLVALISPESWVTTAKAADPADGTAWTIEGITNSTGVSRSLRLTAVAADNSDAGYVPVTQAGL